MWPIQHKRKHFKLYLNPDLYNTFRLFCKHHDVHRVNRLFEAFMTVSIHNPILLKLVIQLAEKYSPGIFNEPSRKEKLMEKAGRIIDEAEQLLGLNS